jgi:hypothetical protein
VNDWQRRTVGPWTLGERLGRGGDAVVCKATRSGSVTSAALKLINTTKIEREPYQRFVREIEFLRSHQDIRGLLPLLDAYLPDQPVGCQKSACPVSCSDDQHQPQGIMIIRVPPPALSHLRPALRLSGSCSAGHPPQRTPNCWCCGTRSPYCAAPIPVPGRAGPTARSSPHSSGSCQQGCGCTGWSPPAPSCGGTAA